MIVVGVRQQQVGKWPLLRIFVVLCKMSHAALICLEAAVKKICYINGKQQRNIRSDFFLFAYLSELVCIFVRISPANWCQILSLTISQSKACFYCYVGGFQWCSSILVCVPLIGPLVLLLLWGITVFQCDKGTAAAER